MNTATHTRSSIQSCRRKLILQIFVRFTVRPSPARVPLKNSMDTVSEAAKTGLCMTEWKYRHAELCCTANHEEYRLRKKRGERRECKNSVLKRRKSDGLQSAYAGLQWKCRPALKRKAGFYALSASFHSKQPFAKYPVPAD